MKVSIQHSRKNKITILFLITASIILTPCLVIGLVMSINRNAMSMGQNIFKLTEYRLHPSTGYSSSAVIQTPKSDPLLTTSEDYISFRNSKGSLFTISKFGNDEKDYSCSGVCECGDTLYQHGEKGEDEHRRSLSVVSKGLAIFISAVSATMALKVCDEYLKNACSSVSSNKRESGKYPYFESESWVEEEDEICIVKGKSAKEAKRVKKMLEEDQEYIDSLSPWRCRGKCLPKNYKKEELATKAQEHGCIEWGTAAAIVLYAEDTVDLEDGGYVRAKEEFRLLYLHPYCQDVSGVSIPTDKKNKDGSPSMKKYVMCHGGTKTGNKDHIVCKKRFIGTYEEEEDEYLSFDDVQ